MTMHIQLTMWALAISLHCCPWWKQVKLSAMGVYDKAGIEFLEDALVGVWESWVGD